MTEVEPPHGSVAWEKYVSFNLPREQLSEKTQAEMAFSEVLLKDSKGAWNLLDNDFQLMLLRGYEEKKDRLQLTLDGIKFITEWRAKVDADNMLNSAESDADTFFHAWKTCRAGDDKFGHTVVYDRIECLDFHQLFALDDEVVLKMRTKQLEVIRGLKRKASKQAGHRVCKHIYILDLSGLSINKHFTGRVRKLLQSIFKIGGDGYPDSLWSLWLLNTPHVFRMIWSVIAPSIDPVVKAKIRMCGGKDKYLGEMEKCGIPRSSVPVELGGTYPGVCLWEDLKDFVGSAAPVFQFKRPIPVCITSNAESAKWVNDRETELKLAMDEANKKITDLQISLEQMRRKITDMEANPANDGQRQSTDHSEAANSMTTSEHQNAFMSWIHSTVSPYLEHPLTPNDLIDKAKHIWEEVRVGGSSGGREESTM